MAARTLTGWSLAKWLGRMILWVPPLTPIGIWLSLRHHRWKARMETDRRIAEATKPKPV